MMVPSLNDGGEVFLFVVLEQTFEFFQCQTFLFFWVQLLFNLELLFQIESLLHFSKNFEGLIMAFEVLIMTLNCHFLHFDEA